MNRVIHALSAVAIAAAMVSCAAPGQTGPKAAATTSSLQVTPPKVTADCLAALRKMVGDVPMEVMRSEKRQGSYIIDVKVKTAEKPWRCFHDGTKCTGTEYQGEG